MSTPKSYKGVKALYDAQPAEIRNYFAHVPDLIDPGLPYDIALAYLFSRIERAHRRALYCGATRRFWANSELTDAVVLTEYLTRDGFKVLFRNVYGKKFPESLADSLAHSENMRDTGMHGKKATPASLRRAIGDVFQYAKAFNQLVDGLAGFRPFGDLRGFRGRGRNLDKETSRWILKGLGFSIK